jgi:hypothetical protein
MRTVALALAFLLAVVACGCATADVPSLSPAAERLRIGKNDPEPGMREIGQIEAVNGTGCGAFGAKGTYEGAMNDLKNRGAAMNADYVQIFTVTEPHGEPGCYQDSFLIRATAFKASRAVRAPAPAAGVAAAGVANSAQVGGCEPPCSPGFACKGAVCEPLCNPPCEAGEICTRKRVCEEVAK